MTTRALAIAGTHTGVGKTSVAVGLMAALARRERVVQPFKIGPDFIDPTHHRAATGRWSHNLDSWMLDRATNRELFARRCRGADIAVVEGVMGLFDGASGGGVSGSTAEMARWLGLPVVLVVDAWPLAGSVAAVVDGYAGFDPELDVAGVILNRVAGEGHADLLREALADGTDVPVLGAIPKCDELELPDRHLGLHMAGERSLPQGYLDGLARTVSEGVDLDRLVGEVAGTVDGDAPAERTGGSGDVRLGVAYDDSFCFYYRENLELLEEAGAELVYFSPLEEGVPEGVDGLYLGGGYPEHAPARLRDNAAFQGDIVEFAEAGGPVYAECGGLMVLGEWMETRDGERFEMAGVFPWGTKVKDRPLMDYVEVSVDGETPVFRAGETGRGHLFHYSEIVDGGEGDGRQCYRVAPVREDEFREGYTTDSVLASYVHLHFASNPRLAEEFVEACRQFSGDRPAG
jgi:cobyrinic acid a,c-diamide synthase